MQNALKREYRYRGFKYEEPDYDPENPDLMYFVVRIGPKTYTANSHQGMQKTIDEWIGEQPEPGTYQEPLQAALTSRPELRHQLDAILWDSLDFMHMSSDVASNEKIVIAISDRIVQQLGIDPNGRKPATAV